LTERRILYLGMAVALAAISLCVALWGYWSVPALRTVDHSRDYSAVTMPDMDSPIPPDEIASYEQSARAGDTRAAIALADHYAISSRPVEERRWLTVAAGRGDCIAMGRLRGRMIDLSEPEQAGEWTRRMARHSCQPG
jgi:hypothetical protein